LKEENVYEVIKGDPRFSILTKILENTGIGAELADEKRPFTFFAPTNDALDKLPKSALLLLESSEGQALAFAILGDHLIPDSYLYSTDLRQSDSVKTLHGNKLKLKLEKNTLRLGAAYILTPGIAATNGVIFPVDRVMPARRSVVNSHKN
jgi:uncharacterized surface protein with fasciclin (FAS1) repeats